MNILVLNAGSSSVKYQLFDMPHVSPLAQGSVERIGEELSAVHHISYRHEEARTYREEAIVADHRVGLEKISALLLDRKYGVIRDPGEVAVIGHRVVQGGEYHCEAVLVTQEVQQQIEQLTSLAPLHNPANLMGIRVAQQVFSKAQPVAVFDTAFHQTLPDYAFRYPIPNNLYEEHHVRVYGMHGTSHRFVAQAAADYLQRPLSALNLITIHLGNGCSMAAVQRGVSIDTSMGLTPLAGLMMGTRAGDIDPAVVYYLHQTTGKDVAAINHLLNHESGLKGIAGRNDLREVTKQYEAGDDAARLALAMYGYRIKKYIGAYTAATGPVDALVFTGGVGENSALVRQLSCDGLAHLGITIDAEKNNRREAQSRSIHQTASKTKVLIIPTNEELAIAQQSYELVTRSFPESTL